MSRKIIGVTVGSPLPKPNLMQTDPTKGDYVKGKEEFVEQFNSERVDLTGYATENWVEEGYQPKGDYLTQHQDISGKLDADKLPEAINEALAQAKASGAFDGTDGKDGINGKDGYTPVKGVDYFDGKDGKDGVDGQPGKDGTNGKDGVDGKTPVRGEDYWTDADKQEIVNSVLTSLPTWNGGSF